VVIPPISSGAIRALVLSLRPSQWVKNLFVFSGLVIGQKLLIPKLFDGNCTLNFSHSNKEIN
jgi:hypothetical protein